MNRILYAVLLSFIISPFSFLLADSVTVSNKVVMVDQNGTNNAPEVVATMAQAAATQAAVDAAGETAAAAAAALQTASNNINQAIAAVNAGEVVVYRTGFVDSFASITVISGSASLTILNFERTDEETTFDGEEYRKWRITYGFNEQVGAITPIVKYCPALSDTFDALDTTLVGTPVHVQSITKNGVTFPDCYTVEAWIPAEASGFVKVYIDGSSQGGDTATMDLVGGVKGGANFSGHISPDKTYWIVIKGGIVTKFEEDILE